jgi:hypothetical protein
LILFPALLVRNSLVKLSRMIHLPVTRPWFRGFEVLRYYFARSGSLRFARCLPFTQTRLLSTLCSQASLSSVVQLPGKPVLFADASKTTAPPALVTAGKCSEIDYWQGLEPDNQ